MDAQSKKIPSFTENVLTLSPPERARGYIAPFLAFMGLLAFGQLISKLALDLAGDQFWLVESQYWIFPLQAIVCGVLLWHYRKDVRYYGVKSPVLVTIVGLITLAIWVAPQYFPNPPDRTEGFNPDTFLDQPALYWSILILRFIRLVIVVPFLEEIFWRGFLMRYLINEKFTTIPFGTFQWKSFLLVALLFGLAHWGPDFYVAIITGLIFNAVAVYTRSLGACVLVHAVTNLALGIYIMQTRQWGFW